MRKFWGRLGGPARVATRRHVPTVCSLESRQLLATTAAPVFTLPGVPGTVTGLPGAIVQSEPVVNPNPPNNILGYTNKFIVTAAPKYLAPIGGYVPVVVTGQFLAESPAIIELNAIPTYVNDRVVQTSGPGNGKILYVYPQNVTANFRVVDEYRQVEPRGPIILNRTPAYPANDQYHSQYFNYTFSFTVYLQSTRSKYVVDGRHYYITIAAEAKDTGGSQTVAVTVLHGPGKGLAST